ncbi:MAG: hypothetical protein WB424_16465 [Terracidiphilus sp.]
MLKILTYLSLLFLIAWVITSALGKRNQMNRPAPPPPRVAQGSVWAVRSVPASPTQTVSAAVGVPGYVK